MAKKNSHAYVNSLNEIFLQFPWKLKAATNGYIENNEPKNENLTLFKQINVNI